MGIMVQTLVDWLIPRKGWDCGILEDIGVSIRYLQVNLCLSQIQKPGHENYEKQVKKRGWERASGTP